MVAFGGYLFVADDEGHISRLVAATMAEGERQGPRYGLVSGYTMQIRPRREQINLKVRWQAALRNVA